MDTPAMGSAMPDIPEGQFAASGFVMAMREQARIQDEKLDSLYVVDVRDVCEEVFHAFPRCGRLEWEDAPCG
jgi:hypothetical protein